MPIRNALRSLLFVPGDSDEKLAKAARVPADALVIDWEDAVGRQHKAKARIQTIAFAQRRISLSQAILIRINPVSSDQFADDCAAMRQCPVDAIMLSKCRSADDILVLEGVLDKAVELRGCTIYPLVESPDALMKVSSMAVASDRVAAVAFGAEDFSAEMGIVRTEAEIELLYARCSIVTQSRAAGRDALDTPSLNFRDLGSVRAAAYRARNLGFRGKLAIHPSQVPIINAVFTPSVLELDEARRIVAAASLDVAVSSLEGTMIDEAVLRRARRIIQFWDESQAVEDERIP